jgi:hydroxymethylpyrimidine pyrophosphatase-like HAD family hydrolase
MRVQALTIFPELFEPFAEEVTMATGGACSVINSEPDYFEVLPPGVSKETAMVELALHLSVDLEEVIAFGDNLNDLAMLRSAGLGVAMGNAHKAVLEAADVVIDANSTDAIAFFLDNQFVVREGKLVPHGG